MYPTGPERRPRRRFGRTTTETRLRPLVKVQLCVCVCGSLCGAFGEAVGHADDGRSMESAAHSHTHMIHTYMQHVANAAPHRCSLPGGGARRRVCDGQGRGGDGGGGGDSASKHGLEKDSETGIMQGHEGGGATPRRVKFGKWGFVGRRAGGRGGGGDVGEGRGSD